ncbi:FecR domain-containing protein [Brenneria goodwinii]|uniref:FecR family protein n=1 Tax=Brenneria goodwinii TaxID=1109412 RepID=UPI000EF21D9E|nr:FecR domain-containing protein [Brenneria goodwinii]MCG8157646.1 FecR domain-containing protein [Brenneria goodwinii]MCG8161113.1 FecR domain-containing protein [Brenneria goodwinii]MCG8165469.1 FecR domain-containing protein [Brenneria goodwinii]MCG8169952.1 FecR domain-containing protein [Brenneria goodwinii]MCG8177446.1 FecR domain-containing protein [Brenneria goodwinii]
MKDYPPEIRQQAALWAVRLAESPQESGRDRALRHWLRQDPRHALALRQAQSLWQGLGSLSEEQKRQLQPLTHKPARMVRWRIAALLVLGLSFATAWLPDGLLLLQADYRAGNQVRSITLPDGSKVDMDAGSAIALDYSQDVRRVKLLQGNVWFSPSPVNGQEKRPFQVEAASGITQAMGTQFMIQNTPEMTTVGVIEHSVKVAVGEQSLLLHERQAASYSQLKLARLNNWNSQDSGDWQRGLLIFKQQPLTEVIARINRYHSGTVIVTGEKLRQSQVSGIFSLSELDSALNTISTELGAKEVRLPGVTLLY